MHAQEESLERCSGCGGLFPAGSGPTHRYMASSPGCWAAYGETLAREYADPARFAVHRLTVDAYAAQHPGEPSPQSVQSVAVHLVSLCLVVERSHTPDQATAALRRATQDKARFRWLEPPDGRGTLTAADMHRAESTEEHTTLVRAWAADVWAAWSEHHATVRAWAAAV